MSADFKVYYDSDRKNVVVGPNTRLFAAGSLIAQADRGRVSIYYRATNYREVYLPFARFAKQDGSPAGASLSAVIDYLNAEFNKTPFEAAPAATGVPLFVAAGETYAVPANAQALYSLPIELDDGAALELDGALVEVD